MLCLVAQLCPTLCDPVDCSPPGSSVHGDSPGKSCPSPGDRPNPGIEPRPPALEVGSLPSEPQGKPNLYWRVLISAAQETVPGVGPGGPTLICQFTHPPPNPCPREGAWVWLLCLQADLPTWSISGNLNTTFPSSPTTKHQAYLTPHSLLCLCLPLSLPL